MSDRKIFIEVRRDEDDGYLYVVFTDRGEEFAMIASGSQSDLDSLFENLKSVTGRNL